MITVILTIHVLIVLALIGIVLLQRSEGGALGMGGGGGGGGGFMTSRGAANALTRTTSILAGLFFATSISLAIFADRGETERDLIRELTGEEISDPNAPISTEDLTRTLGAGGDDIDEADTLGLPEGPAASSEATLEDALEALGAEVEATADDAEAVIDEESDTPVDQPEEEPNE